MDDPRNSTVSRFGSTCREPKPVLSLKPSGSEIIHTPSATTRACRSFRRRAIKRTFVEVAGLRCGCARRGGECDKNCTPSGCANMHNQPRPADALNQLASSGGGSLAVPPLRNRSSMAPRRREMSETW
jgi:hypothetical protein